MLNWRKSLIGLALRLRGEPAFRYLRFLRFVESFSLEELLRLQNEKVIGLIRHAYKNVPYYKEVLSKAGVVKGETIDLDRFGRIPILTKQTVIREGATLYSSDHVIRNSFRNTTGGSTGEPVGFLQDKEYEARSFATRFLFDQWGGKDVGEREILLWGSERDVLGGSDKLSTRLRRWGFNTLVLNSFLMTDEKMGQYVERWNNLRPKQVWAYTSSILELARYIKRRSVLIHSPASIICAAETLTEDVRQIIEETFQCPALNQYGSREAGAIACECLKKEGLHVFVLDNKVEILNDNLEPCGAGQMGKIYITTLNNYSMPLIRYDIGDMAVVAENKKCSCGRSWPLIANVIGRHIEAFRTRDGRVVPGQFFIHFVGVVYNEGYIKRFQVIQKDYDKILVRVVINDEAKFNSRKQDIVESIRKVMGEGCKVDFEYVDDIPPAKSGKYLYTLSEVPPPK